MNVCFLSSAHPPYDKRVFNKEAVSLAAAGFDVTHLAPGAEVQTIENGVKVVTYRPPSGLRGRLFRVPQLYRLAARMQADCYHCSEVDSWFVGVLLKLLRGKKVIFDVHEDFPSTFAESRFPRWLHLLAAGMVRLVYKILTPFTDRIVLAKRAVGRDFRHAEHKQVLVENFAQRGYANLDSAVEENGAASANGITAIHLGLLSRVRGWPQLLEALARMQSRNLGIHIVGTFNDGSQAEFEERVRELGLQDRVLVEDWMPFEQAWARIRASHIGLVLFQPGIRNHVYALPHKMFDYMLAGIPVIAPDFAEQVAEIITEVDCGILLDPSSPQQVAAALDRLVSDEQERKRLGRNGQRAVLERYNWEAEAEKLIGMYQELAENSQ